MNDFKPGLAVSLFLIIPLAVVVWGVLAAMYPPLLIVTLLILSNGGAVFMMWATWRALTTKVAYIKSYRYTRADHPWSYWYAVSITVFGSAISLLLALIVDRGLLPGLWK